MRRKLFNLAAVISLLLFAAMAALWVRSYWVRDVTLHDGARSRVIESNRGSIMFSSTGRADHKLRSSSKLPPPPSGEWTYMRGKPKGISQGFAWNDPGQRIDFSFAGFRWHVSDGGKGRIPVTVGTITGDMIFFPSWWIVAPHWFGVLLFGTFPAIYLIRRKKRQRLLMFSV